MEIIVIEGSEGEVSITLLKKALQEIAERCGEENVGLRVMDASALMEVVETLDLASTTVAVVVAENLTSTYEASTDRHVPCDSIATIQRIARTCPKLSICAVLASHHSVVSGLDTAALLVCGATAVCDERALCNAAVVLELMKPRDCGNGRVPRQMLLIGRCVECFVRVYDDVGMRMDETFTLAESLRLGAWKASIALAQLELLQPNVVGGHPFALVRFAEALNAERDRTGFHYSSKDLATILGALAWMWIRPYSKQRLFMLPEMARQHGYGWFAPAIIDPPCGHVRPTHIDLWERTLEFIESVHLDHQKIEKNLPCALVSLNARNRDILLNQS